MRLKRIEQEIKELVATILLRLGNSKLSLVTLTEVQVSPDLAHAKMLYSYLGSQDEQKKAHFELKAASGYITGQLGKKIRLKNTPKLRFIFDPSLQKAAIIGDLIQEVNQEVNQEAQVS